MISPFLKTTEAAELLRFVNQHGAPNLKALRHYLKQHAVPTVRRGRAVLIRREDLEATLTPIPARRTA